MPAESLPVLDLVVGAHPDPLPERRQPVWAPEGYRITAAGDGRSARCVVPSPTTGDLLVHPGLSTAAVCLALHGGGDVLHGGLVHTGAGPVALLAGRGGGKTTTLAHLARHGATVLADDQVVIRHGRAHAGPRCLDLRPEAAELVDLDEGTPVVRGGRRRRLRLPPCPDAVELAAVVVLEFGPRLRVEAVNGFHRLPVLARHRTVPRRAGDHTVLLDLARLPLHRVIRPRGRDGLDAVAELLHR